MKSKEKIFMESVIIMGISIVYSNIIVIIIVSIIDGFHIEFREHINMMLLMLVGTISAYMGITWNEKTYTKKSSQKGRKKY